ncbi:MAG: phosphatase PAP2 family protein [Acidobacteriota bacterium]
MRQRLFLCQAVLITFASALAAAPAREDDHRQEELRKRFFDLRCSMGCDSIAQLPFRLATQTVDVFKAPENQRTLGIGLAVALLAIPSDDDVRFSLAETQTLGRHRDSVFEVGDIGGSRLGTFGAAGALYGIGLLTDRPQLKSTGKQAAEALLLTNLFVAGVKQAVRRQRPDGSDRQSFPSGHTANAFTLASVIHQNHGLKTALPAYAFATFVAYSRINDDRHFLSDVILGAAVGITIGRTVSLFHKKHMKVAPLLGRHTRGLLVSLDF